MSRSERQQRRAHFSKRATPYLYMAPTVIWLIFFIIYPLVFALLMAFKRFKLQRGLSFWNMPWQAAGR